MKWPSPWADVFERRNKMNSTEFREFKWLHNFEILTTVKFGLLCFCNFFRLISHRIKSRPAVRTQCSVCTVSLCKNCAQSAQLNVSAGRPAASRQPHLQMDTHKMAQNLFLYIFKLYLILPYFLWLLHLCCLNSSVLTI